MQDYLRSTPINDWSNCKKCRLHAFRRNVVVRRSGFAQSGAYTDIVISDNSRFPQHERLLTLEGLCSLYYQPIPSIKFNHIPGKVPLLKQVDHYLPHVLFIGEAPVEDEDRQGQPFMGKAGHILDCIFHDTTTCFYFTITNTICCRPVHTEETTDKKENLGGNRQPKADEILSCLPHTQELLTYYRYDGVILLGKVAEEYWKDNVVTDTPFADKVPTLKLFHPAFIARMDYKHLPCREEAMKIDKFIQGIINAKEKIKTTKV